MERVTIDLANVETKDSVHVVLKSSMNLPEYYGGNLDALYDILTSSYIKKRVEFTIIGTDKVPDNLKSYIQGVLSVFKDAQDKMNHKSDSSLMLIQIR